MTSLLLNNLLLLLALLASIGAQGSWGLVLMAIILNAVGLPLEGIGLILAVGRILDMFRTAIMFTVTLVARL